MKKYTPWLLLLPFLSIMALLLASIWNVLVQSLGYIPAFGLTRPTLQYYLAVFRQPEFLSSLWVSLKIALSSAVLASVLGTLLCYALVTLCPPGSPVRTLVRLPILIPHAVAAVFTINIFSQTGILARIGYALGWIAEQDQFPQLLYTPGYQGAVLAYLWKEIPFVAYFVLALMSGVSRTLGEAAENLGASPVRAFFHVTLPLTLPAVVKAFLIIFLFAFGGYELPLLLGATVPKALPVYAYIAYTHPDLRQRPYAMAINGVILLLSTVMALLYQCLTRRLLREGGASHGC